MREEDKIIIFPPLFYHKRDEFSYIYDENRGRQMKCRRVQRSICTLGRRQSGRKLNGYSEKSLVWGGERHVLSRCFDFCGSPSRRRFRNGFLFSPLPSAPLSRGPAEAVRIGPTGEVSRPSFGLSAGKRDVAPRCFCRCCCENGINKIR